MTDEGFTPEEIQRRNERIEADAQVEREKKADTQREKEKLIYKSSSTVKLPTSNAHRHKYFADN